MKKILGLWLALTLLFFGELAYSATSALKYNGRIDFNKNTFAPRLIWQGTVINTHFSGSALAIGFENIQGIAYFDVNVDGQVTVLKAQNGWLNIPLKQNLKQHSLTLFKRTEASVGNVGFLGIKVQDGIVALKETQEKNESKATRFIFYGDSITAGACNEDGASDQWKNFKTHNSAKSYAALSAKILHADYRNISVSGMGVSAGYQPYVAEQVWNRLYPDPQSPRTDISSWQPNIVFLNYGENDDSFTRNQNITFPIDYGQKYIQLVKNMRVAYPESTIVILRGGMYGGARSKRLKTPWEHVVKALEREDNNVYHYVFKHWSNLHPRVSDHKAMALELVDWIKKNNFIKS